MKRFYKGIAGAGLAALLIAIFAGQGYAQTYKLIAPGANAKIKYGIQVVTGSSTFSSGLGTVTAVVALPDAIGDDKRYVMGTSSGANITLKVYGVGAGTATALSTTATNVQWFAVGSP